MKLILERLSGPEIEPLTLAEMKRHLRCFDTVTDEDDDIAGLIVAAREWVEDYTGRAMVDQTWRQTIGQRLGQYLGGDSVTGYTPGFLSIGHREWLHWMRRGEILLHRAPLLALTSFVSVDAAGVETEIDPTSYQVWEATSKWPRVVPLSGVSWTGGIFRLTYRAGFADRTGSPQQGSEVIPVRFKQAMKLWAEANYDRDPKMTTLLLDVAERLVKSERANLQLA